jgi:hypothetical protein
MTAKQPKDMASFYEFWNGGAFEGDERDLAAVPAKEIDKVLELVNPKPEDLEECRYFIARSILKIRQIDPIISARPADLKRQLNQFEMDLRKVRIDINKFPQNVAAKLRVSALGRNCDRVIKKSAAMAATISVKPSGGTKFDAARRMTAARHGFHLTDHFSKQFPALTKGGLYFEITDTLYRVATRKKGHCTNACAEYFRELEEYGLFDKQILREIRQKEKLNPRRLTEIEPRHQNLTVKW